jgi:hypothetical protein
MTIALATRDAHDAVGRVEDRFVPFVPAHSAALTAVMAEELDDLAASRCLPV